MLSNTREMLLELFILSVAVSFSDGGSYIATFPDSLIPGVNLDVRITVLGASGTVNAVASLHYVQNNSEISSTAKQVANGVPSTLAIKVPAGLSLSQYMVSISGSGGLTFKNESKVNYEANNLFLFLQTDKTRYSAGQEVKYRAILLHPNLLGYKGPLTITVFDGKSNKIDVIDHLTTKDGVVSGKLTLSREPVFGSWTIQVDAVRKVLTKNFEVNDYVVPRFSVQITLQKEIQQTMFSFELSVKARFTFNSDVLGNCSIQIYNKNALTNFVEYWKQIRGQVNFTIPMADLRRNLSFYDPIIVRAMVTDNATALTIAAEEDLKFSSDSHSSSSFTPQQTVTITKTDKRNTFVPGLTYHTPIFIGHDDEPVGTSGIINVKPTVTTAEVKQCNLNNPPTKWLDIQTTVMQNFTVTFDESGYGALNVPISVHTDKVKFELSYGSTQTYIELYSVSSQPVPLLRMNVKQIHARVGDNVTIVTEATEQLNGLISYEIYARGILRHTFLNRLVNAKRTYIDLKITGDLVPQAYVVATHLTRAGHLLSDYIMLKVDGSPCKNKVSVTYNATSLEPRQKLKINLRADPNSTIYLMFEDEKNRLIGTENDIFSDEITGKVLAWNQNKKSQIGRKRTIKNVSLKRKLLNRFGRKLSYINYKHGQKKLFKRNSKTSTEDIYHESGVVILSNIDMYQEKDSTQLLMFNYVLPQKCIHITTLPPVTYSYGTWVPGIVPTPAAGVTYAPNRIPTPAPGSTYAPGFYPTWVPGMVPTPAPGMTYAPNVIPTPAPASVSAKEIIRTRFPETWLWDEYHIGPSGIHTVIHTVPDAITAWVSSVFATNPDSGFGITGTKQKITVKKSFFMTMDLPTSMLLGEEVLIQITVFNYMSAPQQVFLQVIRSDDPTHPIPAATMVQANEGHSTYVRVTPKALGTLKINVHAKAGFFSASATDAIEKEVAVLPIGVHKTINDQHLVDVSSGSLTFTKTILLKDPQNMVPGTKHAYMQITGNFMVPSITGLQKLIQIPSGCGEQTMIHFAPDVFIMKYMNITNQLTNDVKNKAVSAIKSGYQHELEYRHSNGPFSVWGERDPYGSTWLTAYVLKCFSQAKSLITIDSNVMTTAMNWLLLQQNTDGSFRERRQIIHVDQWHTGTGIKLTAFTLISIMEYRDISNVHANAVSSAITKGKQYLESRLSTVSDAYTLSIVCYALALSKSSFGPSCFTKLDHSKNADGDYVYWQERTTIVRRQTKTSSSQTRAPARDIETSAYALLTFMALGHHAGAFPIVKWLVAQRNPYGGFSSTQDTVISIQALTEYAMKHSSIASNYGVQFNTFGMNFMHSYKASPHNFDSLHTVEIPSGLDNVIVQAMGDGIAVVDIVQSFYVSSIGNGSYISVAADIEKESLNSLTVRANIQWNGPTSSHMIMMEIETPTGFVVDRDFFIKQTHVRKHETNGRKVALYLDEIIQNGQSVVTVKMDRSDPVVKNQACHIIVYDYYEPTYQAVTRYESGLLKRANICDVCPLCNFCTGSSGFSQIGIGK